MTRPSKPDTVRTRNTRIVVANTVANVIAALLTYQLPTMLVQLITQFPVILSNDLSFLSPNGDVELAPLNGLT